MAERYTTIFGDQIDVTALGLGLKKDVDDNLEVAVDDTTIEISTASGAEGLQVKDLGISTDKLANDAVTNDKLADEAVKEANLDVSNAPTDGYVLSWNDTAQKFEWIEDDSGLSSSDFVMNEVPSGTIGGGNTDFTLANAPVAGTVEVYLNGMIQAPGSSEDYTIAGSVITFAKAPRANSVILVSYIKSV